MCFQALLGILNRFNDVDFDIEKLKIKNVVFLITENSLEYHFDDYEDGVDGLYFVLDNNVRNVLKISVQMFNILKDYLLNFNIGNYFIFDETINLKMLKDVAITNNELIYMTYDNNENLLDTHRYLVNRVIGIDEIYM